MVEKQVLSVLKKKHYYTIIFEVKKKGGARQTRVAQYRPTCVSAQEKSSRAKQKAAGCFEMD